MQKSIRQVGDMTTHEGSVSDQQGSGTRRRSADRTRIADGSKRCDSGGAGFSAFWKLKYALEVFSVLDRFEREIEAN